MLRRLSAGLLATATFVAPLPAIAQDGSADDLGVMSISLKDVVKPTIGFQGALQGAGTPNQAGIGGFLPLAVGENSVFFPLLEALACPMNVPDPLLDRPPKSDQNCSPSLTFFGQLFQS